MLSSIIEQDIKSIEPDFSSQLKSLEGKTVLITGGNGFLGSYFADLFASYNRKAQNPIKLLIINKSPVTEKSRLSHLLSDSNVGFITADVGKPFYLPEGINVIIHAASYNSPPSFSADPLGIIDANVSGTRTLLEYARSHLLENFLFFSTNEIYGNPLPEFIPTLETYPGNIDSLDERSCYAESKRLAENICMIYHRKFNVPVKILRILLAYGPGMRDDGKVITDFIRKAREEKKIIFKDKGDSLRSFCYISDAVKEILAVMFLGKNGEAYNIGSDLENITIRKLAIIISEIIGNGAQVEANENALPRKIYGVNNRHPDITKVKQLGVHPKVLMKEGIARLIAHSKEVAE